MMMNLPNMQSSGFVPSDPRAMVLPTNHVSGLNSVFKVGVVIENAQHMESAYIRTRHNNLRCFPQCGKVHKTKSFCGTPLFVHIKRLDPNQTWNVKELQVIGEFRNVRKPPAFSLMASCTHKTMDQAAFVPGHLSGSNDDIQFTINPPRKWRYRARIAQVLDMHVFTVYVVAREMVIAIKDTPQFQVVPIWKADDAMLRANDGEGVDEEEGSDAEDEVADDTEVASKPGLNNINVNKKSRTSMEEDTAPYPLGKLERLQASATLSNESPAGSQRGLSEPATGGANGNFAGGNHSYPSMNMPSSSTGSQSLNGVQGGMGSFPSPPPSSSPMFTSSFFPMFQSVGNNGSQNYMSSSMYNANRPGPNISGATSSSSPSPMQAPGSMPHWHPMAAPGFSHSQPGSMMDHAALFGTINNNGNGHQIHAAGSPLGGTGTAQSALQNRFLSNLLSNAYLSGSAFSNLVYTAPSSSNSSTSMQSSHSSEQQLNKAMMMQSSNSSEQMSKAMMMQSMSPVSWGGGLNAYQQGVPVGGFHSNLAGQTMNLASGKNAKEKHQD